MHFIHPHKIIPTFLIMMLVFILSACDQAATTDAEAQAAWKSSAHNDLDSPSFTRWDEDIPPEIPANCAKCHSTSGYLNFLGADGSSPGRVEGPAPTGTTVECKACHNEIAEAKDFARMPSGLEIVDLGQVSNCLECHQGRASSLQVAEMIADHPKDEVNPDLSLPNIHANPVGATFYGTQAKGGGEYPQYRYVAKFNHLSDTCVTCHDSHTLQVRVDTCSTCHLGATNIAGVRNIRSSRIDFDGDGDISEGVAGEVGTMMEQLLTTIRLYAALSEDTDGIVYDGGFLNQAGEKYTTWTPDLLQAAYNYQYAAKDPGSYSHNPKYIMQLLYDSIDELGGSTRGLTRPATEK